MRQPAKSIVMAMAVVILPLNLMALDLGPGQASGSFKYGRMAAADIKLSEAFGGELLYQGRASKTLGGSFDYPIAPHLHLGLGADMHYCYGRLVDLTISLKGLIASPNGKFAFRPGLGVGGAASRYASLLTVRAFGELQASVSRKFGIGLEAGVWYTPSGGDVDQSIRIGPVTYLRGAVLFSYGKSRPTRSLRLRHDPLPFRGAIRIGLMSAPKALRFGGGQKSPWTDHGFSVGISADSPTPVLGFIGAALDWHNLGASETLFFYGFRGSVISEIHLGWFRFRPVGMIGIGLLHREATLGQHTDHMAYGVSLESFWDVDAGPGWLLEVQYLELGHNDTAAAAGVELKPMVIFRLGMTF